MHRKVTGSVMLQTLNRKGIVNMKRNLLALAVGAAILLPLTAQAAPTVYGRLNLSVDYIDPDTTGIEPTWTVNSNASRIGVKGNEKLSDDFTAVYKAEWQINGDVAAGGDLAGRERYIGLKHSSLGTIRLGAIDSPLKTSEDMVDMFNDHVALDMGNAISGQSRLGNSINYVSPKILDVFGANVTFVPGETGTPNAAVGSGNDLANGISAAFSYEDDSLYLSLAMDKEIAGQDLMRVVGRYKMDKFVVAGLYQMGESVGFAHTDSTSFVLSASYEVDKLTFRGEILNDTTENFGATTETETQLIGVGVDYNFTQNTKVFGNLASVDTDTGVAGGGNTTMVLGGGVEVRF
jgi:predicted porin